MTTIPGLCAHRRLRPFPLPPVPCPNVATRRDGPFWVCDQPHPEGPDPDDAADLAEIRAEVEAAPLVIL